MSEHQLREDNRHYIKKNKNMNLPISHWAAEDRPSEKMHSCGNDALTNAELLSIIIGSGSAGVNAVDTSRKLLAMNNNSLKQLFMCDKRKLSTISGIGSSKASKIRAALELGCRMFNEQRKTLPTLLSPTQVYNYMLPHLYANEVEEFWIILCNQKLRLIKAQKMFTGGITEVIVDIRTVIKEVLLNNAPVLYICHNHPSGEPNPSKIDDELTEAFIKACKLMRIKLLDHIIITDNNYYSYHENGRL